MIKWNTGIILNPGTGTYGKSHVGVVGGISIGDSYYETKYDNGLIVQGNVGIGNTSPTQKLHVSGSGLFTAGTLTLQVVGSNTATGGNCARVAVASSNAREAGFSLGNSSSTANCDERWLIGRKYNGGSAFSDIAFFYTTDNGGTNGAGYSEMMRIKTNGNVGINKANPSYKLDVNGTGRFSDNLIAGQAGEEMRIGYTGFSNWAGIMNNSAPQYALMQNGDGKTLINSADGQKIDFRINNANKMTISGSRIGIGTSTPSGQLHVCETAESMNVYFQADSG